MRRLSDREVLNLALQCWDSADPVEKSLQRTGVFLWLHVLIVLAAIVLDMWLANGRLKEHCGDLALPRTHIECAGGGEGEASGEGKDVRHAADADPADRSRP